MFDSNAYWLNRGITYHREARLDTPFYHEQEAFVAVTVKNLNPLWIFEVGCGFGRITRAIKRYVPYKIYIAATDLSSHQIANARIYCQNDDGIEFDQYDILGVELFSGYDLVIAIEMLLHIEKPRPVIERLLRIAPKLLHEFDPTVKPGDFTAEHCFAHDFQSMYKAMGLPFRELHSGQHSLMLVG